MPFEIQSTLSLQPMPEVTQVQQVSAPVEVFPEAERQEAPIVQPRLAVPQSDPSPVSPAPAAKSTFNWKAVIPYVWLSVAACFGIYTLYAYLSLKYKVREAVKIQGGYECEGIETAFILGFIRKSTSPWACPLPFAGTFWLTSAPI